VTAEAATALLTGLGILRLAHCCRVDPRRCGVVETAAVVLIAGLFIAVAPAGRLLLVAPIGVIGVAAALVDADERRLPNVLNAVLAAATAATLAYATVVSGDTTAALRSVVAAAAAAGAAATVKAISPESIGWGDVKLLPTLAATLAWAGPATLYHGVLTWAALLVLTVMTWPALRGDRRETVPYGPALVAGALGALLAAA
jgi:leader peptidase (prepilin peptidase) / N-methyltransferase